MSKLKSGKQLVAVIFYKHAVVCSVFILVKKYPFPSIDSTMTYDMQNAYTERWYKYCSVPSSLNFWIY